MGAGELNKYRLFRQGCYDRRRSVMDGYELLLREQVAGQWRVPLDFSMLAPDFFAAIVTEAVAHLPIAANAMINLDHDQFIDHEMIQALIAVQQRTPQQQLIIELTERDNGAVIYNTDLIDTARYLTSQGLKLSLDDVGSGKNDIECIKPLLPYASEMKFALQNFDDSGEDSYQRLVFWEHLAISEAKDFVLEGIETQEDLSLADTLGVNLRQGYYYDRPHRFY